LTFLSTAVPYFVFFKLEGRSVINPQKGNAETMPDLIGSIFQYVKCMSRDFVRGKIATGKAPVPGQHGNFFRNCGPLRFRIAVTFTKTDCSAARTS
jgi:hypothetical protein